MPQAPANALDIRQAFGAKGDGISDDSQAFIRAAKTGKPIQVTSGTYLITTPFQFSDGFILYGVGKPILKMTGRNGITAESANNIGSYGITFEGKGIDFKGDINGYNRHVQLVGNVFRHIWDGSNGVTFKYVADLTLRGNQFIDIIEQEGGWRNYRGVPWNPNGSGFWAYGFGDHIDISFNYFEHMGFNGIKGFFNGPDISHDFKSTNNEFAWIHRIASEFQHCSNNDNGCLLKGQEGSSVIAPYLANNYAHDFWYANAATFGFSWPIDQNKEGIYINNTVIDNIPCCTYQKGHLGYGLEVSGYRVLVQGNVVISTVEKINNSTGWGAAIGTDRLYQGYLTMNIVCGPNSKIIQGADGGPTNNDTAFNYVTVQASPYGDKQLTSSLIEAGIKRDTLWVRSRLSIAQVTFLDSKTTKIIGTSLLQDKNSNFAHDLLWYYHLPFKRPRFLQVVITDVAGHSKIIHSSYSGKEEHFYGFIKKP
ncbi:hypothetical protein GCM10023231_19760 [Olivibacter ginsenosidimutans]|uniref:Pectate lyase superfamily protein domain-containing protein n=1 Tax=Olivibacter ginsenosidimutans TaxID=1176537 RepID=A0ABP9B7W8_9SPHI